MRVVTYYADCYGLSSPWTSNCLAAQNNQHKRFIFFSFSKGSGDAGGTRLNAGSGPHTAARALVEGANDLDSRVSILHEPSVGFFAGSTSNVTLRNTEIRIFGGIATVPIVSMYDDKQPSTTKRLASMSHKWP